ncbi:MAG TPA: DUF1365 domain-containing protein [Solirubrobacteraceae bacterium]
MNSCLYEGSVRHRRTGEITNELRYPLFMAYLDLDELPELFDGALTWSARRPALAWFRRRDHLGDPRMALKEAVGELVRERTGMTLRGPVRLLTNLRYFGHCFNPVSFYYCFDELGTNIVAVIAHVTNTPWGDSHCYVMAVESAEDHGSVNLVRGELRKRLHVSPLMGMDHVYDWRLSAPKEQLMVHIDSRDHGGETIFDATLSLCRREISNGSLRRALLRYPFLTLRILARIYGHALALRLRGASYFPRPDRPAST